MLKYRTKRRVSEAKLEAAEDVLDMPARWVHQKDNALRG